MTKLSVNINKVATLRNSRGGNLPDLLAFAKACEKFGADGITVHPRPDERHIRHQDVLDLKPLLTTELNIEGYPAKAFLDLVLRVKPAQVTLVPDSPEQLTSNHGWDTVANAAFLSEVVAMLKTNGIRVSLFVDPDEKMVEGAKNVGADRVELYTGPYSEQYELGDKEKAIEKYVVAANVAHSLGLGINAGHDLNRTNLHYLLEKIPFIAEVSIGHALISDALYLGLEQTIKAYKSCLI